MLLWFMSCSYTVLNILYNWTFPIADILHVQSFQKIISPSSLKKTHFNFLIHISCDGTFLWEVSFQLT